MQSNTFHRNLLPHRLAVLSIAFTFGIHALAHPALAQPAQTTGASSERSSQQQAQSTPGTQTNSQTISASTADQPPVPYNGSQAKPPREGFWGRVNPFARKKWVNNQLEPIHGQLTELDEVNARNANDIRDVDSRAQSGIRHAQSTADAANERAKAAGAAAQQANSTAQGAAGHVDRLNTTINGLDQYRLVTEADVIFRGEQPTLSIAARKQLDALAASVEGQEGYILEVEAHSPLAGSAGIQRSERMAEAVKRYLVTEHEIPVYRMHAVALGNAEAPANGDVGSKPVRTSSVHVRLMENSLAAQGATAPRNMASSIGADRP